MWQSRVSLKYKSVGPRLRKMRRNSDWYKNVWEAMGKFTILLDESPQLVYSEYATNKFHKKNSY